MKCLKKALWRHKNEGLSISFFGFSFPLLFSSPSFLWHQWLIFETLCPSTDLVFIVKKAYLRKRLSKKRLPYIYLWQTLRALINLKIVTIIFFSSILTLFLELLRFQHSKDRLWNDSSNILKSTVKKIERMSFRTRNWGLSLESNLST